MDEQRLRDVWSPTIGDWQGDPRATLKPTFSGGDTTDGGTLSGADTVAPAESGGEAAVELGGLELLDEIGAGGMGIVFRARQPSLDRDVAVKRIRQDRAESLDRFRAEARVTGNLEHPNIVPVYDLGTDDDGKLFLAMKLVGGQSWSRLIESDRGDLERHLSILGSVANAVAFAHSRSIVHRDLKPDNVMVGEFGEVLLMDWGIAARLGGPVAGTAGSPSYMAPEQAEGRGDDVGRHTDIYLLGALLHEILTGKPPHLGASLLEVLAAASRSEPPRFGPGVPTELQTICHKAMAREPADRFANVTAFQEALKQYSTHRESMTITRHAFDLLEQCDSDDDAERNVLYARFAESVAAFRQALLLWNDNAAARDGERRARTAYARSALAAGDLGLAAAQEVPELADDIRAEQERVLWAKRNARRMRTGLVAAAAVIIAGLSVGIFLVNKEKSRAQTAEKDAKEQRNRAVDAEADAKQEAWAARLGSARVLYDRAVSLIAENEPNRAAAYLLRAIEIAPPGGAPDGFVSSWRRPAWAEEAWSVFRYLHHRLPRRYPPLPYEVPHCAATSRAGDLFAVGGKSPFVQLYRFATGAPARQLRCATRNPKGEVIVNEVAFTADGKRVVAATEGLAQTFDIASGTEQARCDFGSGEARNLILSADNRTAVCLAGKRVVAWNLQTGNVIRAYEPPFEIKALVGLPSPELGSRMIHPPIDTVLLIGDATGKNSALWRFKTGEAFRVPSPPGDVVCAAGSRDGRTILLGLMDGTVVVWERGDVKEVAAIGRTQLLHGHSESVSDVAFGARDLTVYSASWDATARVWDARSGRLLRRLAGHEVAVGSVAVSAGGAVTAGLRSIRRWDVQRPDLPAEMIVGRINAAAIAPDRSVHAVAADGPPHEIVVTDRRGRQLPQRIPLAKPVDRLWFGPDGQSLYWRVPVGETWTPGTVYRFAAGTGVQRLPGTYRSGDIFPRHDLAVEGKQVVRLSTGKAVFTVPFEIARASVSRDGSSIALTAGLKLTQCHRLPGGELYARIDTDTKEKYQRPSLGSGGKLLLMLGQKELVLWDCGRREPLCRIHDSVGFKSAEIGPDGTFALVERGAFLSASSRLELLDLRTGAVVAGLDQATGNWSPDGRSAFTLRGDRLGVWQLTDGKIPASPPADLTELYRRVGWRVAADGPRAGMLVPVTDG